MKLLSPRRLHRWLIKEKYDIEVSYLEGPSARIISGCPHEDTKLVTWIHCLAKRTGNVTLGFRSYKEANSAYGRFRRVVCVSRTAQDAFRSVFPEVQNTTVVYNTNDSASIRQLAKEPIEGLFDRDAVNIVGIGKLVPVKAFDRFIRIHARLRREGYNIHSYILGDGALRLELEQLTKDLQVQDSFTFLGYQTNLYKFIANCDLYVCSSLSEGFSTAATEALIVGTPVCTVDVSGMKEMLGENNEYGIITENSEEALYLGIKSLLDDPELLAYYKKQAGVRGKHFSTEHTVRAAERLLTL